MLTLKVSASVSSERVSPLMSVGQHGKDMQHGQARSVPEPCAVTSARKVRMKIALTTGDDWLHAVGSIGGTSGKQGCCMQCLALCSSAACTGSQAKTHSGRLCRSAR